MKKIILFLGILLSFSILLSCNNDDDTNETPVNLPVVIDYHQVVGQGQMGNNPSTGYFSYEQDGLTVEIVDFNDRTSSYYVNDVGVIWLYPGRLKVSNIDVLEGLSKISVSASLASEYSKAWLYDANDVLIEEDIININDNPRANSHIFETNLDQASYLFIQGAENQYSSIIFE